MSEMMQVLKSTVERILAKRGSRQIVTFDQGRLVLTDYNNGVAVKSRKIPVDWSSTEKCIASVENLL